MTAQPLRIHQLVELLDRYSDVYPTSPTGARGWIRGRREILDRDPEVYIEWDKTHWRYHGEKDSWTFAHHFRLVDDRLPALDPADRTQDATLDSPDRCPHCAGQHPPPSPEQERFVQTLLDAQEAAIDSAGYFILTLTPRSEAGVTIYEPDMFSGTLSDTARRLIEAQLVHTAAQLYSASVMRRVKDVEDGR